jgi:hypothetical protein
MAGREDPVSGSVRHLHGPEEVHLAADECAAVCLIRNGASYVRSFVDHYLRLGVRHIFFLDNGSSDGTVDRIREQPRVSLFHCPLPYKDHKLAMKRWLVGTRARDGWCLCADADEDFDYPLSAAVPLRALLRYLDDRGYDAMMALLLDMFPREPLVATASDQDWKQRHRYFDTSSIEVVTIPAPGMGPRRSFWGGVRAQGLGVPRACLTKFPLLKAHGQLRYFEDNAHFVSNARVADVSGVLLHYKFGPCFQARVADALAYGQYFDGSAEYQRYHRALEGARELSLWSPAARIYRDAEELARQGWLDAPPGYRAWGATR